MGAESSVLSDCQLDESPILTTSDWSLHHAEHTDHGQLSVFIDNNHTEGARIDKLALNLRLYRHPFILRYVSCCSSPISAHLLTEKASPLSVVRRQQTDLATRLGIHETIQAVQFLHQRGQATHNNICQAAVFVTPHGRWRLAGLEFLTKFSDPGFAEVRASANDRYGPAIPPEETSLPGPPSPRLDHVARDIYSLGVLITEVLNESQDPLTRQFKDFAGSEMMNKDGSKRPTLETVLQHQYFNHNYLQIVAFLKDLPLRSPDERRVFFSDIIQKLKTIPENLIGLQLIPLILSRYVLMDATARWDQIYKNLPNISFNFLKIRSEIVPHVLCPMTSNHQEDLQPILSEEAFREAVVPQIRTMFLVRDTQIRLTLLKHFPNYCKVIDVVTLEDDILPALLLGIRDSNQVIVSATLRALAELVPILGPEIVIGSNRKKIFTDGSPGKNKTLVKEEKEATIVEKASCVETVVVSEQSEEEYFGDVLPERFPGEGAEVNDDVGVGKLEVIHDGNFDSWDDWEDENMEKKCDNDDLFLTSTPLVSKVAEMEKIIRNVQDLDIMKLDIKTTKKEKVEDGVDFFADMTPDIPKTEDSIQKYENKLREEESREVTPEAVTIGKFAAVEEDGVEGWGEEEIEWGEGF